MLKVLLYTLGYKCLCVYFERQREQRRGIERGRERIPGRLHAVSTEPDMGLEPTKREIMT